MSYQFPERKVGEKILMSISANSLGVHYEWDIIVKLLDDNKVISSKGFTWDFSYNPPKVIWWLYLIT